MQKTSILQRFRRGLLVAPSWPLRSPFVAPSWPLASWRLLVGSPLSGPKRTRIRRSVLDESMVLGHPSKPFFFVGFAKTLRFSQMLKFTVFSCIQCVKNHLLFDLWVGALGGLADVQEHDAFRKCSNSPFSLVSNV